MDQNEKAFQKQVWKRLSQLMAVKVALSILSWAISQMKTDEASRSGGNSLKWIEPPGNGLVLPCAAPTGRCVPRLKASSHQEVQEGLQRMDGAGKPL